MQLVLVLNAVLSQGNFMALLLSILDNIFLVLWMMVLELIHLVPSHSTAMLMPILPKTMTRTTLMVQA